MASDNSQFSDCGSAGAPDKQVGFGKTARHVFKIRAQLGGYLVRSIARARNIDIFGPALLGYLQTMAQRWRQHRQTIGHDLRKDRSALAAPGNQHTQQAVVVQRREWLLAQGQHVITHRIADLHHFVGPFAIQPINHVVGCGNRIDPPCEQPIDPAQHRVLFVDYGGDARCVCCEQGR